MAGAKGKIARGPRGKLVHKEISAEVECKVCNSIELGLPPDDDIGQYHDMWNSFSRGLDSKGNKECQKGVSCPVTFSQPLTGELVTIRVCFIFEDYQSSGKYYPRLYLYPYLIEGKKVRLDHSVFEKLRSQAQEAYQNLSVLEGQ